ncbi:MAG TPA: hypothetical protein VHR66_20790 [Gemmataceae bacterium]|jgi:hypothetical protein|nr:hypothetical protein [Gemmataceae bacterium]
MANPRLHRLGSYLLGTFVCVQLVYVPLANFLQLLPRRMPPLPEEIASRLQREGRTTQSDAGQAVLDRVGSTCDRWAEVTDQGQGWSLFAPRFGSTGTFLTLQVATDAGLVELRSRFEPADVDHYVRYDVTHYRLFYREMSYAMVYWMWTPDSFVEHGPEWRDVIREHVAAYPNTLPAYVRWRLAEELPGVEVREVVVAVRVFVPAKPGEPRPEVVTVLIGKWLSDVPTEVMPFDPVTKEFVCR